MSFWPDFSKHIREGDSVLWNRIIQLDEVADKEIEQIEKVAKKLVEQSDEAAEQRINQFNEAAEQGIDQVNEIAEQRIAQINNTLQQTVKKFDTVAEQRIDQIENVIANLFAVLKKILSTALFISKIGMLFMLILFLYGDLSSLQFVITAAFVSTAAVYLEQYLKGDKIILIICTFGAVYVAMCFIMKSSAF